MSLKKRGYFFMIDAMLGTLVIVIGVLLITSSYVNVPAPTQVGLLSDDLMNFLSGTKIRDLNNEYSGIGGELWREGLITDKDNTLLQQIGEFYATKQFDIAEKFVQNASSSSIPSQFSYEVWIDNLLIYPRTETPAQISSRGNTTLLLTSKKITFGILNRTTTDMWGPYKAEVFVWQR